MALEYGLDNLTLQVGGDLIRDLKVVHVKGNLDAITATSKLKDAIDDFLQGTEPTIFDLSSLEVIDHSGIGYIVSALKRHHGQGRGFVVYGTRGQPREIVKLLGLDRELKNYGDLEQAIEALRVKGYLTAK